MSAKNDLKRLAAVPLRLLPSAVRRRAIQVLVESGVAGSPADAMRELLTIEQDLSGTIDLVALDYDRGVHVKHRLMRYHDFFVDRIAAGERVLDVGCGYGAVAHSVATRAGAQVVGLDMVDDNVARARARFAHERLTFVVGAAPDHLPPGPFDVVIASNVLEHIDDRLRFLTTIQRQLAPRRWLIRVPMIDRDWRVPLRQELGLRHFSDPTHCTEYTRESFEREMAAAAFAVRHLQVNWGEIWAEVAA
jgi:2-polyprenyl-3-methyl-5-hydroxy-6-metoxy-1,4-benzoquinol methylase